MDYKICRACKNEFLIQDFPLFSTSGAGRKNTCNTCSRRLNAVRKKLKLQNRPPDAGPCPICGVHTMNWILDHCHFNDSFRGYICNSCNLGLGRFNDDMHLLFKAIEYLRTDGNIIDYQI
jgi:hypothetical protein